jgi:hypothetical protein
MIRQLAKDVEYAILKLLVDTHLNGEYTEKSLRAMTMKDLIEDCHANRSDPNYAATLAALDDIARDAGYQRTNCRVGTLAICLSREISARTQDANSWAHDEARKKLRKLSAAGRAALIPDDNVLSFLYERFCDK